MCSYIWLASLIQLSERRGLRPVVPSAVDCTLLIRVVSWWQCNAGYPRPTWSSFKKMHWPRSFKIRSSMTGSGCRSKWRQVACNPNAAVFLTYHYHAVCTFWFSFWRPDAAVDPALDLLVYCIAFSQGYRPKLGGAWCEVFGNEDDVFMVGKCAKTRSSRSDGNDDKSVAIGTDSCESYL